MNSNPKMLRYTLSAALLSVAIALGCDAPAAGPAATPPASATAATNPAVNAAASTKPATAPANKVAVPGFPADGLYVGRSYTMRVATGERPKIEALIDRCLPELTRGYGGKDVREQLLKLYDAVKPAYNGMAVLIEDAPGSATRPTTRPLGAPPPVGQSVGRAIFLAKRSYVAISDNFKEKASKAWGSPVDFNPPSHVNYFIHPVRKFDEEDEPAPGKPAYYYRDWMGSGSFSLTLRVGDRFTGPQVPSMLYEDVDVTLFADKLTFAALPASRPATQPAK